MTDIFTKEEILLIKKLKDIRNKFRIYTKENFNRINPFIEDLTSWKEKGKFIFKGENITVYDSSSVVGDVVVGENTWIGPFTALDGSGGLKIGKNCSISSGVSIVSHDSVKWALSGGVHEYEYEPILIGDNCFIGTRAFVCKGVKIGNHCLVGANSTVTKSFNDYSIIAGSPAKKIGVVELNKMGQIELNYF